MDKDKIIAKQQMEIEHYKYQQRLNHSLKRNLSMKFYAIGAPLNDNILNMNNDQLKWCFSVNKLIEELDTSEFNPEPFTQEKES